MTARNLIGNIVSCLIIAAIGAYTYKWRPYWGIGYAIYVLLQPREVKR